MYIFMKLLPVVIAYFTCVFHRQCPFLLYLQNPFFFINNMLYFALYFFPELLIFLYHGKDYHFLIILRSEACEQGKHHRGPDIEYFFTEKPCFYFARRWYFRFQSFQKLAINPKRLFQIIYAESLILYDIYLFLLIILQQFFVKNYYLLYELIDNMLDFGYVIRWQYSAFLLHVPCRIFRF